MEYRTDPITGVPIDRGRINCPLGLDADYAHKVCRNCGRQIALFRARMTKAGWRKARWQHVGDGLAQYRSWNVAG